MNGTKAFEAILVEGLEHDDRFALLAGMVVPRPIAWVSTRDAYGAVNLAPFSFYNAVTANPPTVMVAIEDRSDGQPKDTLDNLRAVGVCVVHVVDEYAVDVASLSSVAFPSDVSEPEALGLELRPGAWVDVPRLTQAPACMECRLAGLQRVGKDTTLAFLEVIGFHVRADLLVDGRIDQEALCAVGRVGGPRFSRTSVAYERSVPSYESWVHFDD